MNGFGAGASSLQRGGGSSTSGGGGGETLEKIDMSLDDIIKLNKREERKHNAPKMKRGLPQNGPRQFRMRRTKWGIQDYPEFLSQPQLPITFPYWASPAINNTRIGRDEWLALFYRPSIQSLSTRIGNKLYQQKDTRQATFLFRRGLKVQAQVHPECDHRNQGTKHPWRTSTRNGGILTISIDNPGAVLSPISLKPRLPSNLIPPFLLKKEPSEEKKVPKGVPLQFDINSVGKQTSMTLNERFGILKEQRTALAQNKGTRFVTVA
ncbi:PREDICTED: UAP56-interacting factor [Thamnophis sirtalis]|uniref:UAP56-interacting factor n=1 Tax=Thamnophis sirtalis TaxID=35019 RepID=A0A6I9YS48_9SAUR|nr:PREDICTED: UAP56-interacting factor [Thamnophis sirtalis]